MADPGTDDGSGLSLVVAALAVVVTVGLLLALAVAAVRYLVDEPEAAPVRVRAPDGAVIGGAEVFVAAGCGSCHRLRLIGATGTKGPDLDRHLTVHGHDLEYVAGLVRDGGRGMPAFRDRLTERQIRSVAAYVLEATEAAGTG